MSSMSYEITQDEKIIDINYISEKDFVYDLQVENDNNFFANGVLVHNCLIVQSQSVLALCMEWAEISVLWI